MKASDFLSAPEQQFYEQLFIQDPNWSHRFPNFDEASRAGQILPILALIAQRHLTNDNASLQIIDVGCGRGWLTSILSIFGEVIGLDPVQPVIAHALRTFPHLQFVVGTPEEHAQARGAGQYDVVVCSEVIEHVPHEAKSSFMKGLASLIRPEGDIILTTPRGELFQRWIKTAQRPQPIEAWLTEGQLDSLVAQNRLVMVKRSRFFPMSLDKKDNPSLYRSVFQRVFRKMHYVPENDLYPMIYQIVWLRTEQ